MFCAPLPLQLLSKNHFISCFWNGVDLPPSYLDDVFKYTGFFLEITPKTNPIPSFSWALHSPNPVCCNILYLFCFFLLICKSYLYFSFHVLNLYKGKILPTDRIYLCEWLTTNWAALYMFVAGLPWFRVPSSARW